VCNTYEMLAIEAGSLGRREPRGNQAQGQRHGTKKSLVDLLQLEFLGNNSENSWLSALKP
jgi:hypothetical protein